MTGYRRRKLANRIATVLITASVVAALVPLFLILGDLLSKGAGALDVAFLTELPKPVGEPGGGMANAIVGTLVLVALACGIGLPVGILGGVYLAEFGDNRLGSTIRFAADLLNGVPSIVIGIFAYSLVVLSTGGFSAIAGGVALGVIMIPTLLRTTEEIVRLVPQSLREASLALGVPAWRTTIFVVMRTARGGIVTGAMLAIARIAGETAPLLFTAFGNRFWSSGLGDPIAALPLQIYSYAISPFEDWHRQAWAGALVLIAMLFLTSVAVRWMTRGRFIAVR